MTDAARIYHSLQTLARRQGRATSKLHTLYALERFLERLTRRPYRNDLVLKGGVLLAASRLRRPTRDVDMQALDVTLDEAYLRKVVEAVASVNADDGVVFDAEDARVAAIRDEDEYSGLRIRLTAHLHTAKLFVHVDLRNLSRRYSYRAGDLASAIAAVATHRGVQLASISNAVLGYDADSQRKWASWRRKTDIQEQSLLQLGDQLREVGAFLDPIMLGDLDPETRWNPDGQIWEREDEDPVQE